MTAVAGGHDIRCAPYATFGTQELSDGVVQALEGRLACLMAQHGQVSVGPTLDKALAARDNNVPFYVALPASTIDWQIDDGVAEIPIEARSPEEVTHIQGRSPDGQITSVQLSPCLLYTSPSPRDRQKSRMPSSA